MSYTLSNLLRDGLSEIRDLRYGKATAAGSTTSLTDALRPTSENALSFIGGTLIVLRDAGGAGAAPEGEFSPVSNYASGVFTLADALSADIASGDRYGISTNQFVHEELLELANEAIQRFQIAVMDTSITTAVDQTEYVLPAALKAESLLRVEYQGNLDQVSNNRWVTLHNADVSFTPAGEAAAISLPYLPSGRTVRISYLGTHPTINAFDDPIAEVIHRELARASFVERLANRNVEKVKNVARPFTIGYDKAAKNYEDALLRHPIYIPQRRSKLMII